MKNLIAISSLKMSGTSLCTSPQVSGTIPVVSQDDGSTDNKK